MFKSYLKMPGSAAKQSQRQRPEITESHPELEGPHRAHRVQLLEVAAAASNRALGTAPRYRLQKRHHQMRVAQLPGIHILASGLLSADRLHFSIRESHLQAENGEGGRQRDCRPEQVMANQELIPKTTRGIGSSFPELSRAPPWTALYRLVPGGCGHPPTKLVANHREGAEDGNTLATSGQKRGYSIGTSPKTQHSIESRSAEPCKTLVYSCSLAPDEPGAFSTAQTARSRSLCMN